MKFSFYDKKWAIFAILLPIFIYSLCVAYFAVNVPIADDFDNLLYFLNTDTTIKLNLLFSQHNEHRLFFNRIVAWLFYALFGKIDFAHLIYLANFALVITFVVIIQSIKITTDKYWLYIVPVSLIIFQLQSWENMTWAMAALQNYYVITFSLLSLYFFNRKTTTTFVFSLFFATLATYTSGSGILVFIVLLLWTFADNFLKKHHTQVIDYDSQKKTILVMWTVLVFVLYFCSYIKPGHHPKVTLNLGLIEYFLTLLGNNILMFDPIRCISLAKYIGLSTLIWIGFITYKQYYLKNPLLYYFILLITGCLFVVSLSRAGFGIEQALASRYKVLSTLLLAVIYCSLIEIFAEKLSNTFLIALIFLSIIFNAGSFYTNITELSNRNLLLNNGLASWVETRKEGLSYPNQLHASTILQRSIDAKIYIIPLSDINKSPKLIESNFDAEFYWQKYPDVAENAIYGRTITNGAWLHWSRYGQNEGRVARKKN